MYDSVLTKFTKTPFPNDRPLMPSKTIVNSMAAIEKVCVKDIQRQSRIHLDIFLQQAFPLIEDRNMRGVNRLEWGLMPLVQRCLQSTWAVGYKRGQQHMKREMRSIVDGQFAKPPGFREIVEQSFSPLNLSPIAESVSTRTLQIAGNYSADTLAAVKSAIISAIIPEDGSTDPISRTELLDKLQDELKVRTSRAVNIARTETTRAYNEGRRLSMQRARLVTHSRFIAITDDRTTDICLSRNGLIFEKGSSEEAANTPSLHFMCRSVLSPVIPSVNGTHKRWVNDPERRIGNREVIPLRNNWTTSSPIPQVEIINPADAVTEASSVGQVKQNREVTGARIKPPSEFVANNERFKVRRIRRRSYEIDRDIPSSLQANTDVKGLTKTGKVSRSKPYQVQSDMLLSTPEDRADAFFIPEENAVIEHLSRDGTPVYHYGFTINGSYGRGQLRAQRDVRALMRAAENDYHRMMAEIPDGAIVYNQPFTSDGGGTMRASQYSKRGFSRAVDLDGEGTQFARKQGDRMVPVDVEEIIEEWRIQNPPDSRRVPTLDGPERLIEELEDEFDNLIDVQVPEMMQRYETPEEIQELLSGIDDFEES